MKVWGIVLEVTPKALTISLPHGLRGRVAAAEASDVLHQLNDPKSKTGAALRAALGDKPVPSLTELFSVGQYVRCSVRGLEGGSAEGDEGEGRVGMRMGNV